MVYLSVFGAAFLAATIFPFYSEVAVTAAVIAGYSTAGVWLAGSVGNTLGAVANGVIGRALTADAARRRMRISEEQFSKAKSWFQKWGVWSLLMAWLPIGGDVLTVVGGALRVPWWQFVTLVFIGKAGRYAVLIALVQLAAGSGT